MATFVEDGAVTLYHNNAAKIATSATGIDVTGNATADGVVLDYSTGLFSTDKSLSSYSSTNGVYLNGNSAGWLRLAGDGSQRSFLEITGDTYSGGEYARVSVSGSERLRIVSGGDVGIGVTPGNPGWARNLHVHGAGNGGGLQLTDNTSGSGNNDGLSIASYQGNSYFINRENAFMAFSTNDTERMRIDSTGRLLVGKSVTTFSTAGHTIYHDGSHDLTASAIPPIQANRLSSDGDVIAIFKDSSQVGSIASVNGNIKVSAYGEEYTSLSGTSVTVDCRSGNNFALTTSGNTTFTFSNAPTSGTAFGFTLKLTSGGSHTITYPNSVDFAGATAPDAPASGETDVLVFYTVDGGTNWYGALAIDAAG